MNVTMGNPKTKSKVLHFLEKVPPGKRGDFKHFLESPYFNKIQDVLALYNFYTAHCFLQQKPEPDEETIFQKIYPNKDFNLNRIRKLKRILTEQVIEFITIDNFRQNPGNRELTLLSILNGDNDTSYFNQYYKKASAALQAGLQNEKQLNQLTTLNNEQFLFRQKQAAHGAKNHLAELLRAMKMSILAQAFKFRYVSQNQLMIIGEGPEADWANSLFESMETEWEALEIIPRIYYLLNQTLNHPEDAATFAQLKKQVTEHTIALDPASAYDILTATLNNYYRQKFLSGHELLREIFDIYQIMVKDLVWGKGHELSPAHFKNIVSIGSRLGEFEWVKEFIKQSTPYIPADETERFIAAKYNMGILHFYQEDYPAAESCFHKVLPEVKDIFYELDSRTFLLMCYYETHNSLGMESLAHSTRMFLRKDRQLSPSHKKRYLNFTKLYRRLINIAPGNQKKLSQLQEEIDQLEFRAGKSWIKQKVQGMR